MTISTPSFPPADDLLSWIETIDWSAIADRLLTVALYIVATCHALVVLAAPHVAAALRAIAARLDRTSAAPSAQPGSYGAAAPSCRRIAEEHCPDPWHIAPRSSTVGGLDP